MINLKDFPKNSGVYMIKVSDEVIYIGSSKNLYRRMSRHKEHIKKGLNAERNPALYQFLSANPFTVEFKLTDDYRKLEQKLIDKYKPKFNAISAYTGLGARKGREAEYQKQYYDSHKEERKQYQKQYRDSHKEERNQYDNQYKNQQCLYNGETITLNALSKRFRRQGIHHSTIEAKKYLIGDTQQQS